MTSIFSPVDPATVSVAYLKERTGLLFAAMERGEIPDMPLAPGFFRCFTCRREFEKGRPDEEAYADYRRRFGKDPDDPFTICGDCNQIIAQDQGIPLLCPRSRPPPSVPPDRAPLTLAPHPLPRHQGSR